MQVLTKSKPKIFCIYLCKIFWKNVYHRLPYHWNSRKKYFFFCRSAIEQQTAFKILLEYIYSGWEEILTYFG